MISLFWYTILVCCVTSWVQSNPLKPSSENNLKTQDHSTPCPDEVVPIQNNEIKISTDLKDTESITNRQNPNRKLSLTATELLPLDELSQDSSREENSGEALSDSTTICPEELLQQSQTIQLASATTINDEATEIPTSTICPEEAKAKLPEGSQNTFSERIESLSGLSDGLNKNSNKDELAKKKANLDNRIGITTPYPGQISDKVNDAISAKTLLDVQKDSVLLKLVEAKTSVSQQQQNRQKRQSKTFDYSSYYPSQSGQRSTDVDSYYKSQPIGDDKYQLTQPSSYSAKSSVNHAKKAIAATPHHMHKEKSQTYQKSNRRQTVYSKSQVQQPHYHVKQPVESYRNPSLYMRYPTKGSYYKASINRRQFQGRHSSTTVRTTRANIKKKIRPSPVFA